MQRGINVLFEDVATTFDSPYNRSQEEARQREPDDAAEPVVIQHCSPISPTEYEASRFKGKVVPLEQLLDIIIKDEEMSTQKKKRLLELFKDDHKSIYDKKYRDMTVEEVLATVGE